MLIIIMLSAALLSARALNVIILNANFHYLMCYRPRVIILDVVVLIVVMLRVILLNVIALYC